MRFMAAISPGFRTCPKLYHANVQVLSAISQGLYVRVMENLEIHGILKLRFPGLEITNVYFGPWKVIENCLWRKFTKESEDEQFYKRKGTKRRIFTYSVLINTAHFVTVKCDCFVMENMKSSWKVMNF